MADWSPSLYARFEDERTRPARDLVAQVPLTEARNIADMGCGPGNSTELLVERWPGAKTTGLDSSPAMLEEARKRLPRVEFARADAASWVPDTATDLVFANANGTYSVELTNTTPGATYYLKVSALYPGGSRSVA